jgi:hypothetical protein
MGPASGCRVASARWDRPRRRRFSWGLGRRCFAADSSRLKLPCGEHRLAFVDLPSAPHVVSEQRSIYAAANHPGLADAESEPPPLRSAWCRCVRVRSWLGLSAVRRHGLGLSPAVRDRPRRWARFGEMGPASGCRVASARWDRPRRRRFSWGLGRRCFAADRSRLKLPCGEHRLAYGPPSAGHMPREGPAAALSASTTNAEDSGALECGLRSTGKTAAFRLEPGSDDLWRQTSGGRHPEAGRIDVVGRLFTVWAKVECIGPTGGELRAWPGRAPT